MINGAAFRADDIIYQGSDSRIFSAHSLQGGGDSAFVIKCYSCQRDGAVWKTAMREIEAGMLLRNCGYFVRLLGYSVITDAAGVDYRIFLLFDRLRCLDEFSVNDPRGVLALCRDICRALDGLRGKGLVHGDVKPSNIFYDGQKWLLGDLGSVCVSGETPVYGSEGYCPPESFRGEPCDIRSDIYSLGVVMYKLLSGGRLPFCALPCGEMTGEDVYRAIDRRLGGEEIPPLTGIDGDVNHLMLTMCRFDRRKRYSKPSDVSKAAERLLNVLSSQRHTLSTDKY